MTRLIDFPRYLGGLLARLLLALALGTALLTAVRLLPAGPMEAQLVRSAPVFEDEGVYPSLFSWCSSQLDSTTDALILLISACDTGESPLIQAMSGSWNRTSPEDTPSQQLADHYGSGVPFTGPEPYYQYWHGYQLIIRPLLSILDYSGIRLLNGLAQTLLLAVLCALAWRAGLERYLPAYLAAVAMVSPPVLAASLQYSSCYYVLTLSSIFLLWKRETMDRLDGILFLWTGIATAYFDFLTYPAATLGIPAAVYFCLRPVAGIRDTFCRGVKVCFAWALGYGGMWAGKWALGSLILKQNLLTLAAEKLVQRSGSELQDHGLLYSIRSVLSANIRCFLDTPVTLAVLVLGCMLLLLLLKNLRTGKTGAADVLQAIFPFLVIAALPVVWYLVMTQHSLIHYWFTCKALMVSVFALLAGLIKAARPNMTR